MMTAELYLVQTAHRPQRSVMKIGSEIALTKTGVDRRVQHQKFHPYVTRDRLCVTVDTTYILCIWSNVLQLHYMFRSETIIRCAQKEEPREEDILQISIKNRGLLLK